MNLQEWSLLLFLSVIWGGSFFFTSIALKELPPFTLVLLRVGIAALALHLVLRLRGIKFPLGAPALAAFAGMGLLNNAIPFSLIVYGQTEIASGLASILNATTPVFTVLAAHWLTRDEKLTPAKILGVALGFAGAAVMLGVELLGGLGTQALAQIAVLAAALSYAFGGLFGRRFKAMGIDPVIAATGQVTASTLIIAPLALLVDKPWTLAMPSAPVWAAVLAFALVSTALAYIIVFRLIASAGPTNTWLVTFLIPVSAIWLGWAFLGETLLTRHFLGMALIGAGLAAIDGRALRLFRRSG